MTIAVLGGGLQGCCIAMALADRGQEVVIFDRSDMLLSRAAVANEGKIHLGYMYAGDRSLRTAKMMMRGALFFAPFMSRRLGVPHDSFDVSEAAQYVVHRQSQKSAEDVEAYLRAVHDLVQEAVGDDRSYFGIDLSAPIERWSVTALEQELNPREIEAAFTSPEVAIDPVMLAHLIRDRIDQTPQIEVRNEHTVLGVEGDHTLKVVSTACGVIRKERFGHVVNALWDGRIAIDDRRGRRPARPWIHRLKYGVDLRRPSCPPVQRSITIVLGPFGEVVCYASGSVYLTWYPACLKARTSEVQPPHWPIFPEDPTRSEILRETFMALRAILPSLSAYNEDDLSHAVVRGGPIVAWGETDIDDPQSELHRRYEIGVTSSGKYHSVDPGKLTAAPLFAEECSERIAGPERRFHGVGRPVTLV